MTTIAVLSDPPREGLVLAHVVETTPLDESQAVDLYGAFFKDVCRAVIASGGELLVNYRPDDMLPEEFRTDTSPEAELRALTATALDDLEDVRFEPQVGSTHSARVGNTITHLLEREGVASAAVVEPTAPMLFRTTIDSAAMKLRMNEVVLRPSTAGRIAYAGFTESIDFTDTFTAPAVETLTNRATDAGHDVEFIPMGPTVETGDDLVTLVALLEARRVAGRIVPAFTVEAIDDLGLFVDEVDGSLTVSVR